jgi:2,4-dienoyl-CoA reductase (NADPH2)
MYLISQFLSRYTNKRTDRYGSSVENRSRFLLEILAAIRERVPNDYPIAVRINAKEPFDNGLTIEESKKIAQLLEGGGCNIISVLVLWVRRSSKTKRDRVSNGPPLFLKRKRMKDATFSWHSP